MVSKATWIAFGEVYGPSGKPVALAFLLFAPLLLLLVIADALEGEALWLIPRSMRRAWNRNRAMYRLFQHRREQLSKAASQLVVPR